MATKLKIGETYKASKFRSGENSQGPWEMVIVNGGKGTRSILIFPTNAPTGIRENGLFKIDEIEEVQNKAKQDENGKWTKNEVVVRARLRVVRSVDDGLGDYEDFNVDYELDMSMF